MMKRKTNDEMILFVILLLQLLVCDEISRLYEWLVVGDDDGDGDGDGGFACVC